jgi:hypothetical protein
MTRHTTRTRTTLLALAIAAILVPSALARSIPDPADGSIDTPTYAMTTSPAKPTLKPTKPGTKVTQALYLAALAGTATTSR